MRTMRISRAFICYLLSPTRSFGFITTTTIHPRLFPIMSNLSPLPFTKRSSPRLRGRSLPTTSPTTSTTLEYSIGSEDTPKPKKRRRVVTPSSSPQELSSPQQQPPNRIPDDEFQDLKVPPDELRPSTTLTTGQCFHWKAVVELEDNEKSKSAWGVHNATEWIGTLRVKGDDSLVVVIRETPTTTLYRVLYAPPDMNVRDFLWKYFQLDVSLSGLCQEWSKQDERLARISQCIRGVRIIDQDPWECLASFICSSNNNIPRITKILSSIRREYGSLLIPAGDQHGVNLDEPIYSFPSLEALQAQATDKDLRGKCGIGYRAKYILETMKLLDSLGGEPYLQTLKEGSGSGKLTPAEVQDKMIEFSGVGRKVADCVALFSLRQANAIPVDVHVWAIACRDYDPEGELRSVKSLTPTVYRQVEDIFRSRFKTKSGWAHSLLFVAELPSFRPVLPVDLVEEMDKFREEEKARKKNKK